MILSGHGTVKTAVEAVKLGAFDFIEKPPDSERILIAASNALGQKRLVEENRRLRLVFDDRYRMVGESPALEKVWEAVRRASPTNATVLITGESGVGKELVARAIHRNSLRADEAFVQVNCAAIPEELIESELFGHEKGSFTGATEKQIGKFELAHRGTIFLDEVGDMSLRTQAKVLRVLQEGEVERIGSQKTIEVDVRVIAATNKNLEEEIARDLFREDLFFRLSVVPIAVPALRERPEDIAPLVEHFCRQFRSENNVRPRGFTREAIAALGSHSWRGNVRELKNAVERLLIMVEDDEVRPEHLKDVLRRRTNGRRASRARRSRRSAATCGAATFGAEECRRAAADHGGGRRGAPRAPEGRAAPARGGAPAAAAATLRDFKEGAERAFLVQKLRESGWNISATAAAIGTPRSNLYKKLEAYGISQEKDG